MDVGDILKIDIADKISTMSKDSKCNSLIFNVSKFSLRQRRDQVDLRMLKHKKECMNLKVYKMNKF